MNKAKFMLLVGIALGAAVTVVTYRFSGGSSNGTVSPVVEDQPMYWVAPMDPNYKRDKPGKSPMGMDLIAVYHGQDDGGAHSGTIRISPDVVNNLGVRTAEVARKTLYGEIKTVGYVKYDEDQLLHVHPRVEGWIDKLFVKAAGDPVEEGQPLYAIYSPELVNAQEELLLALSRNNQRLIRAAEDRLGALQLPADAIEKLKRTREVKQNVIFYSPQSGVLDDLNIRQGFYVKPDIRIMTIGSLDRVWVEAEIFEDQAADVVQGLPVTMTLDFLPGKIWQGRVDYVYPSLDAKTRTLKVRLRFDNDNSELKPNMFAQVTINVNRSDDTLLIAKEALVRTGSMERVVLALEGGRFKSVEVKTGRVGEGFVEILGGLEVGDRVVTSAQFLLDSESSKTSDFIRMDHTVEEAADQRVSDSVWTRAVINGVMLDHRMVNATHRAIERWRQPAMTMDFIVAPGIDISRLQPGTELELEIRKNSAGSYEVINVRRGEGND